MQFVFFLTAPGDSTQSCEFLKNLTDHTLGLWSLFPFASLIILQWLLEFFDNPFVFDDLIVPDNLTRHFRHVVLDAEWNLEVIPFWLVVLDWCLNLLRLDPSRYDNLLRDHFWNSMLDDLLRWNNIMNRRLYVLKSWVWVGFLPPLSLSSSLFDEPVLSVGVAWLSRLSWFLGFCVGVLPYDSLYDLLALNHSHAFGLTWCSNIHSFSIRLFNGLLRRFVLDKHPELLVSVRTFARVKPFRRLWQFVCIIVYVDFWGLFCLSVVPLDLASLSDERWGQRGLLTDEMSSIVGTEKHLLFVPTLYYNSGSSFVRFSLILAILIFELGLLHKLRIKFTFIFVIYSISLCSFFYNGRGNWYLSDW